MNKRVLTAFSVPFLAFVLLAATGNIRWKQIASGDRHGADAKGQSSDGTGSSGNFAKFNSSGGLTDSGVAASGSSTGALILLEQHTAATSASLDFTTFYSSTYDEYMMEFVNVIPASNNVNALIRMSSNGGVSYDSGSNTYAWAAFGGNSAAGSGASGNETTATAITLFSGAANTANWSLNGTYKFYALADSGFKHMLGTIMGLANDGHVWQVGGSGTYKSASAVNAVQFLFSSGNIASGSVRVYGISH